MGANPIRLATAALSRRIYAGRPTKDGLAFREPRYDVTSDVLKCVAEHVGIGNEATVRCDGEPVYTIKIVSAAPVPKELTELASVLADELILRVRDMLNGGEGLSIEDQRLLVEQCLQDRKRAVSSIVLNAESGK